ncbi:PqiB family protein [soil metagenome]
MSEEEQASEEPKDYGKVVQHKAPKISLVWVFPILAVAAAAWLFWSDWKSHGPEIEIEFNSATGMQAGKTMLVYRGVNSGTVTSVKLGKGLNKAYVKVRLSSFATELAQQGTQFWIDQPEISLEQVTGLESIVQGNSIEAKMGEGGAECRYFVGLDKPPLTSLKESSLVVKLHADEIPYISRGAPVYYRGVVVGRVEDKSLDDKGRPVLRIVVKMENEKVVKGNSRFWMMSAASVKAGPGVLKFDVAGVAALLQGGIAFDVFDTPGEPVENGADFELWANEREARSLAPAFQISFDNGQGLLAGQTQLRYLGVPVGAVDEVKPDPATGRVEVVARLEPQYDSLRKSDAVFSLIRPRISLQGVSGLETLVSGVYIECEPGKATEAGSKFVGRTQTVEEWNRAESESEGMNLKLRAKDIPNLAKGAPVYFHGIAVGSVKEKGLDETSGPYLGVVIRKEFAGILRSNLRFWRMPATSVEAGPGVLKITVAGVEALLQGGVEFDAFGAPGEKIEDGAQFVLFDTEREAKAVSPPIRITFTDGQGLLAGQTQLRYLGVPVGVVEAVRPLKGKIEAVARLEPGFEMLRREGSMFNLIQASISLQGVSGLETLVSGVYIECVPSPGGCLVENFDGHSKLATPWKDKVDDLEIVVTTRSSTLVADAPVYYRNVEVGKVKRKVLAADGNGVDLIVSISTAYAPLIRENTKFWDSSGFKASIGFISIRLKTETPESLTRGGLAFATPDNDQMGPRVRRGFRFEMNKSPRSEWLKWAPTIPITAN